MTLEDILKKSSKPLEYVGYGLAITGIGLFIVDKIVYGRDLELSEFLLKGVCYPGLVFAWAGILIGQYYESKR